MVMSVIGSHDSSVASAIGSHDGSVTSVVGSQDSNEIHTPLGMRLKPAQ